MSQFEIKPASRQGIKPLIGLVGLSGGGKTLTALLIARGLAGPTGKIRMIDTENRRGSYFAEQIPGGYDVINLDPPFSPARYIQALEACEGSSVVVVDSLTHEWSGSGGYLDMKDEAIDKMAGDDWKKREACKFAATARVKPEHNRLIAYMLRAPFAMILCFRGKQKVRMEKDQSGKMKVEKDDHISEIQDSGIVFECLIAGEVFAKEVERSGRRINEGGYFRCTKHTVESLLPLLPNEQQQFSIKHGEALAAWCSAGGKVERPASQPAGPSSVATIDQLKKRLWKLVPKMHQTNPGTATEYLVSIQVIPANKPLASLSADDLTAAIDKLEIIQQGN
jgi:hypothetical protein